MDLQRAVQLNAKDNVAVCTTKVTAGSEVQITLGETHDQGVVAKSTIEYCNKIALCDINEGDLIVKYGEVIGKATRAIDRGALVNDENITGIARAYKDEYIPE